MRDKLSAVTRPKSFDLPIGFAEGLVPIFAMLLAIMIIGQSRPWSDRYPFSTLNRFQPLLTWKVLTVLKRAELLFPVTFRTSLEGRSTRSVGRESFGVKRSVRVQAFTCSRSLTR
jgi:hypothetical protein